LHQFARSGIVFRNQNWIFSMHPLSTSDACENAQVN
jgi:hypothetical protein